MTDISTLVPAACALLTDLCDKPPHLPFSAGSLMVQWRKDKYVESLNDYINLTQPQQVPARRPAFDLIVRAIDALLRQLLLRLGDFMGNKNMRQEPANAAMGLFCLMSQLVVVVEDAWTLFRPDDTGPRWRCAAAGTGFAYVAAEELCISPTRIKSYTVRDVTRTLDLLALRWHRLEPHTELRQFLYALLHRACMLASHPGHQRVFDVEKLCALMPGTAVYQLSRNGLRSLSTPLLRMLYAVEFSAIVPPASAPLGAEAAVDCVRGFLQRQVQLVMKLPTFKKEVAANFDRYMTRHGDWEKWTNIRGIELPRAPSLAMTVRAYTKPADTRLREFVMVDRLVVLTDERQPDYHERWTRSEHMFATICKLCLASSALSGRDIQLFIDYVIPELELPFALPKFAHKREPVIVQMFGGMHVIFERTFIRCASIEHALAVWALFILNRLGGVFLHENISQELKQFIAPPLASAGTELVVGIVVDD